MSKINEHKYQQFLKLSKKSEKLFDKYMQTKDLKVLEAVLENSDKLLKLSYELDEDFREDIFGDDEDEEIEEEDDLIRLLTGKSK